MSQPFGAVLRKLVTSQEAGGPDTDGELLHRFATTRDEAAFATLVRRRGPMVLGVCQRVLGNLHAAEDAFQATFLALVRRAHHLDDRATLSSWLYTVAYHAAVRARGDAARRRYEERKVARMPRTLAMNDPVQAEERAVIDQELMRLPEKYRAPLVLCYLEGKTNQEAAALLGWTKGTVSGRLARARALLSRRLTKRGLALATGGLGSLAADPAVSAALVDATLHTALLGIAGKGGAASIVALSEGALQSMSFNKLKIAVACAALAVIASGTAVGFWVRATAGTPSRNPVVALAPLPEEGTKQLAVDVLRVQLNRNGELLVAGRERPLSKLDDIEDYLIQQCDELRAKRRTDRAGPPTAMLVLRVPGTAEAATVCPVLERAQRSGFAQVRLETDGKPPRQSMPIECAAVDEPDRPELLLEVRTRDGMDAGILAAIVVATPNGKVSLRDAESLQKHLQKERQNLTDKENVLLQVEGGLKIDQFILIVDACLNSGFRHLHVVSPLGNDPDNLHAEAKLRQAQFERRFTYHARMMGLLAKRLEKSARQEDQEKATILKSAIEVVAKEGVDVRTAKIGKMLSGKVPSLQETRELIDDSELLIKILGTTQDLIAKPNEKLKDEDLQNIQKSFRNLERDQASLRKLLRRLNYLLQDQLLK
jgi:RNA polymerase sigma factor (sigma-70 family)